MTASPGGARGLSPCHLCQVVCPWSKPRTLFHRFVAEIATRVPAQHFLVWAGDLVYGAKFEPRPIPEWAKNFRILSDLHNAYYLDPNGFHVIP